MCISLVSSWKEPIAKKKLYDPIDLISPSKQFNDGIHD